MNLKQIYGQTEVSGISVAHRDDDIKFHTVGTPVPGMEVRLGEGGEILTRSPSVFLGYYNNEEATEEALRDGWLYSGDAGYMDDDGHLIVIDRKKDVMELHDGTRFSPQFIENKLKFSPYIKEAVVFGGGDYAFVTSLIVIDFANAGKWAERRQIPYTTFTDLAQKSEIYELALEHTARINADLPESARIQRLLLLHKELDADDEELTRTRKVRRRFIADRYRLLVDALYGERARRSRSRTRSPIRTAPRPFCRPGCGSRFPPNRPGMYIGDTAASSLRPEDPDDARRRLPSAHGLRPLERHGLRPGRGRLRRHLQGERRDQLRAGRVPALRRLPRVRLHRLSSGCPGVWVCLATLLSAALIGLIVERLVLRPLIGEPVISMIMVTIGLSSLLRAVINGIWGARPRAFPNFIPEGEVEFFGAVVGIDRLLVIGIAGVLLAVLTLFFRHTRDGIAMRAIADDQQAALSMGISIKRVLAVAWAMAAITAAVAGIVLANTVGVSHDIIFIGLRVFPVVILGGLDSVPGAIVGGGVIGLLEAYTAGYTTSGLELIVPYIVLILVLMVRPYGLFGKEIIERV